jgi:hypothetical protein
LRSRGHFNGAYTGDVAAGPQRRRARSSQIVILNGLLKQTIISWHEEFLTSRNLT